MMNRGVAIRYGDVAPEAKENFAPTATESEFDTIAQLQQYNLNFPNYANPCELYQTVLDGMATALPSMPQKYNVGLWSEQISNDDGSFTTPIVLILTSAEQYSSSGFTFTFDKDNQIYPTHINVHWCRDEIDLGNKDFYPDDAVYFCQNKVEYFNKVIITFTKLNMAKNRLKLRAIDYGRGTIFYGNELRNVKLIQELDPISTEISINTADFVLDSKSGNEYSFQAKQPISVYFNGKLKATTFVKSAKRKTKFLWNIQTEDYIGLLDGIPYYGGIYSDADAYDLFVDIFTVAKIPYSIDKTFRGKKVTGYIPYTTCRDALMQVAFAVQAVVDTSNSEDVKVFVLEDDVKQIVPLNRIMQGQNFDDEETVTSVEVAVHSYKTTKETINVYDSTESGMGENIFVKFSEPLHDLVITNGEILLSGTNYAVINANENCLLVGQKYEHTTQTRRKNNPTVLANEIEKIVSIENATLVSLSNIDNIIEKCYNWLTRTNSVNLNIVEGKHVQENEVFYDQSVNVGENIGAETEYLGIVEGRLIKQSFNLNGNIIIKKAVLK